MHAIYVYSRYVKSRRTLLLSCLQAERNLTDLWKRNFYYETLKKNGQSADGSCHDDLPFHVLSPDSES